MHWTHCCRLRRQGRVHDVSTHYNWDAQLLALHLKAEGAPKSPGIVKAKLVMLKGPSKFARKERARTPAQKQAEEDTKELKTLVYGETPVKHADGSWTAEASDFLRAHPKILDKFIATRQYTAKVSSCTRHPRMRRRLRAFACRSHMTRASWMHR